MNEVAPREALRIDKLLCFLRICRTRGRAQALVSEGHLRCNGRRVERDHYPVHCGDVLTIPLGRDVRVIEVLALPARRSPPREAQAHYRVLDAARILPVAAQNQRPDPKGEPVR